MTDHRCSRGSRCAKGTAVFADDGTRLGRVGATLDDPDAGLCAGCRTRLASALAEIPDLVLALRIEQRPSLAVRYRTDDISGGGDIHPRLVIDVGTDAAVRLMDHELSVWTTYVAGLIGEPWDPTWETYYTQHTRIARACTFLGIHADTWASAGERRYPARSLTDDPADAPGDLVDIAGRPWRPGAGRPFSRRTGAEAATVVLDLHHAAQHVIGAGGSDRLAVPCSSCGRRSLHREHAAGVVRCHRCRAERSDDGHDAFLALALTDAATLDRLADAVAGAGGARGDAA